MMNDLIALKTRELIVNLHNFLLTNRRNTKHECCLTGYIIELLHDEMTW